MRKVPLYEYECQKCGKLTEILQSRSEADKEVKCPESSFQPLGWLWVQVRRAALDLLLAVQQARVRYPQCHSGNIEAGSLFRVMPFLQGYGDFPHAYRGMGDFPHAYRGMGDFPHA